MDFFSDVNGFYNTVGNNDGQLQASIFTYSAYLEGLTLDSNDNWQVAEPLNPPNFRF